MIGVLAKSGLLAISIPAEFRGADISNAVVADTAADYRLGIPRRPIVWSNISLLNTGTTEQRRAIYSRVMLGDLVIRCRG
ncbi:acyl-CoA dehydrogenase family protein [Pararhizobium sp. LjRoot235]|uniref:hypothetical protein n=1 Tax=Pararhizobium sp. LjRoot235 TaxID=3342291 RepID=UPI003ECFD74A